MLEWMWWETDLTSCRASVVFAIQNWLGEGEDTKKSASQPAYFSVGMARKWLFAPNSYGC
jgi:hypothetical protein